ncbi:MULTISPECIES: ATP-binding protein [unclassified Coleofasciculus]|uniref:ATP-binding protein n=1 Tax=unclassified Coleofasciculus TaxID=2692782 RepID=UPI0018807E66|nr:MULTISPECIES: ATP-binding protein [unclassified Coleofasciculus]MBE9129233.1 two-component sensor histidine kinase [Coleofasciculus sp. LEGE 07081]MBE9148248.1 two-component sensor histidine kinase [Coleofasciculus sp. LEGE 07092]
MAKSGQSSFRRILLSRLLLLSVPVLLTGVYVTYRKARSTLLETARQNLTESAIRKGESIQQSIVALQANLVTASEAVVLQSQSSKAYQGFVDQLAEQLPTQIDCVQLVEIQTQEIAASTCGNQLLFSKAATSLWNHQPGRLFSDPSQIYVTVVPPEKTITGKETQTNSIGQLHLLFSAPVYNWAGQLRYALNIQSTLLQQPKQVEPGSLTGYPVVIHEDGTILAYPQLERVGRNIKQEPDGKRLESIVDNAIAGQEYFQHLALEKNGVELLAGYGSIKSPISDQTNQKWVILAVTPLDKGALAGLGEIRQVLIILTCGLLAACFLATVYVSWELSRPLEKLRDYALNESELHSIDRIPHNFKIREINQLAEALDRMIEHLKHWAEELEAAWKEAQAANQLKNEFLASTSHELRTPLNGIIGCLRLVRDGFCDDREEELDFLQRADDAAIHLLGIINDILDLAKIEAGKLSVEMESVNLRELMDEVINLQAVPIQNKGIEFNISNLDESIPVRADPAKFKQVLLNVVGNAAKFTDSGSITISTRIEKVTEQEYQDVDTDKAVLKIKEFQVNGKEPQQKANSTLAKTSFSSQVVVTVKDTGIGIDPAQQSKLFRPFVMVDGSTTRKYGGTGLGLAISRNLIEMMGGTITLFSEGEGQGTTVKITLPTLDKGQEIKNKQISSSESVKSPSEQEDQL